MKDPVKFGNYIKQLDFEIWFRYFFKEIEGVDFVREPYHDKIFDTYQNIYEQNDDYRYTNLNLAPRSGKTASSIYFIAYAIVNNPSCEFIYTSFSIAVLRDVHIGLMKIFNHPVFKEMYHLDSYSQDLEDEISSDWLEIYKKYSEDYKKEKKVINTKLITIADSKIHLQPIGSTITGLGFGKRNSKLFSGILIMDDIQKIQDIKNSELLREKTNDYFSSVLVSRANNPLAPILNVQQRICLGDMTHHLETEYEFTTVKAPLMVDGVCQLPTQYDERRLKIIMRSEFDFQSQYQQNPINAGGNLFKEEWFEWTYNVPSLEKFQAIFFTVDTAFSEKEDADFTAIGAFGILDKKLYVIDLILDRIDSIELPKIIDGFCSKYRPYKMRELWIEQKASGITIQQALRRYSESVKLAKEDDMKKHMKRLVNKVERANDITGWIDDEIKNIVISKNLPKFEEFKSQLLNFPSATHDDAVDVFIDAIRLYANYYSNNKANYTSALNVRRSMGM